MARHLCVWSPSWAIANQIRRDPFASRGEAFALAAAERGVRRLVAVDGGAARLGLFAGQKAADAKALAPDLVIAEAGPAADAAALTVLADWCARFSPAVAIDPPDGLDLDITGVAHLWGGEAALMADLVTRLAANGIPARGAIASSPAAAWALAHFAAEDQTVASPSDETARLASLPVAALRLSAADAAQIGRLGLRTIGALASLPRDQVGRRFGPQAMRRLDQALGVAGEALAVRRPLDPWFVRLTFAEPISAPTDLTRASGDIAARLCRRLEAEGKGARRFDLAFHRLDGGAERRSIGLALPGRDPAAIARLFAPLLEDVDPGFGIEVVTLAARDTEVWAPRQQTLPPLRGGNGPPGSGASPIGSKEGRVLLFPPLQGETAEPGCVERTAADAAFRPKGLSLPAGRVPPEAAAEAENIAPLIDRLANRLGEGAVWRAEAHPSHAPERAITRRPPLAATRGTGWRLERPRPLRLFRKPEPVEVMAPIPDDPPVWFRWRGLAHRIRLAEGPERLAREWWRRPFDEEHPGRVRDYYRVEDEAGARFWLFRDGLYDGGVPPKWWLHGLFG